MPSGCTVKVSVSVNSSYPAGALVSARVYSLPAIRLDKTATPSSPVTAVTLWADPVPSAVPSVEVAVNSAPGNKPCAPSVLVMVISTGWLVAVITAIVPSEEAAKVPVPFVPATAEAPPLLAVSLLPPDATLVSPVAVLLLPDATLASSERIVIVPSAATVSLTLPARSYPSGAVSSAIV